MWRRAVFVWPELIPSARADGKRMMPTRCNYPDPGPSSRQESWVRQSSILLIGTLSCLEMNERAECHGLPCKSQREKLEKFLKVSSGNDKKIDVDKLPTFTSKQVSERNGQNGGPIWMSYGGYVYNVTDFVPVHPGGTERISRAAGAAIEPYWHLHQQHFDTDEPMRIMQSLIIGRLDEGDQSAIDVQLETLQQQFEGFRLELDMGDGNIQELSLNDLKDFPKIDRWSQVGCPESKRPVSTSLFGGVLMKDLIGTVPVKRLVFYAMDGETVTVATNDYQDILVSYEENGASLTQGRGFPLRIILPGRRVIKWVKRIEVVS